MDPSRKRKIRLVVALTAAVLLASALIYTSFSASSEAKSPSQLMAGAQPGQSYQLTGKVANGSVRHEGSALLFRVRDRTDNTSVPVRYTGDVREHVAVRERAGLFDISHMGEFHVEGPGALEFLNRVITNDLTAAVRPERPDAVGVVDHHARVVALRQLDDLSERRDVAVHREDAVGDDQRATVARLAQPPGEVLEVAVAVHEDLGMRQPAAVDDAGVVQLVGEDDAAAPGQRRDRARPRRDWRSHARERKTRYISRPARRGPRGGKQG